MQVTNVTFYQKLLPIVMKSVSEQGVKARVSFVEFVKNLRERKFEGVKIIGKTKVQADIQKTMIHGRQKALIFIKDTTHIRKQE